MAPTPIQRRACPGLWPTHKILAQRPRLSCPLEPASGSRVNKSTYPDVLKAPLRIVDANGAGVTVPYAVQSWGSAFTGVSRSLNDLDARFLDRVCRDTSRELHKSLM